MPYEPWNCDLCGEAFTMENPGIWFSTIASALCRSCLDFACRLSDAVMLENVFINEVGDIDQATGHAGSWRND